MAEHECPCHLSSLYYSEDKKGFRGPAGSVCIHAASYSHLFCGRPCRGRQLPRSPERRGASLHRGTHMNKHLISSILVVLLVAIAVAGYTNDVTYTYDQLNRLIAVEHSDGYRIEYTYDEIGNRTAKNVTLPSGFEAAFTAAPTNGDAPLTVSFADQSIGTISSRSRDFGDGGTSTSQNPTYTYTTPGTYTAVLTVSNGAQSSVAQQIITVKPPRPVTNFTASPTSGDIPLAVSFTDSSTGAITGWSWNFGDGQFSSIQSPTHTYTNAGSYTISLTVSGPGGNSNPMTASITALPPAPVAGFSSSPTNGAVPLTVQFTDASTGVVTARSWDFGDGGTSTSQSPTHTYTSAGNFIVSLTPTGPGGANTVTQADCVEAKASSYGIDQYTKLMLHFDGPNGSRLG